jgi:hypothetical protein
LLGIMVKKHLQENPFSGDINLLLKSVAFVVRIIIWTDNQVTRL